MTLIDYPRTDEETQAELKLTVSPSSSHSIIGPGREIGAFSYADQSLAQVLKRIHAGTTGARPEHPPRHDDPPRVGFGR